VLDRQGVYESVDASGTPQPPRQFLPRHAIRQRKEKPGSQDVVVPLVRQLLSDEAAREKILIFRNQRGSTEGCANYLANERLLPPATDVIEALPRHDRSATTDALARALGGGAAFHNSNLTREERAQVERAFRDPDSPVRVLAATAGVAAGINTPASTVIIVEHEFPWEEDGEREYSVGTMRNMAGRAGRFGFRETGRAILLADTPVERRRLFARYVTAQPEPVTSAFRGDNIGTWLIRLFAQVEAVPADTVGSLLANTYGGYLAARRDPSWQTRVTTEVAGLVRRMRELELLEENAEGALRLTLLGRACGQSSLALPSALRVVELVRRSRHPLTPERLMALVQALPELDAQYTPVFPKGQRESAWVREAAQMYGHDVATVLQQQARDQLALWARAKRACVLAAWIAGEPTDAIRVRFSITPFQSMAPGDVRGIADTTRYHLRSAYTIAQLAAPADAPDPAAMDRLLLQLEAGLPADALALLELPITLARGELLALRAAGIRSAADVRAANETVVNDVLGAVRAQDLRAVRRPGQHVATSASEPTAAVNDTGAFVPPPAASKGSRSRASAPAGPQEPM
jgi:replicative superfamily II helicase